jgi:outer membrane murein-binding lipoprotein Lpp
MGYYQYGTSARKLKPEYDAPPKKSPKKSKTKAKTKKNSKTKKVEVKSKKIKDNLKAKELKTARINFVIVMVIAIGCILFTMYRSVKINETFTKVQALSKKVSEIEKENSQISVQIQNSLNLNNIESIASSTLGMQKLSSKQTIYVSLDTKDYTEVNNNKSQSTKNENIFQKLLKSFFDLF